MTDCRATCTTPASCRCARLRWAEGREAHHVAVLTQGQAVDENLQLALDALQLAELDWIEERALIESSDVLDPFAVEEAGRIIAGLNDRQRRLNASRRDIAGIVARSAAWLRWLREDFMPPLLAEREEYPDA